MLLHKKPEQKPLLIPNSERVGDSSTSLAESADYQNIIVTWIASMIWIVATIGISVVISPILLIVMCVIPVGIMLLSPLAGLVMYLTVALWQNTAIGIWSPYLSPGQLTIMQGTNFLICALFGSYCFFQLLFTKEKLPPASHKIIVTAFIFLLLAGLYLLYGAAVNPAVTAIAYFRNFTLGLFCLAIGTYVGRSVSIETFIKVFVFLGSVVLLQACMEFFFTKFYYGIFNLHYLYAVKYGMEYVSLDDTIEQLKTVFFNSHYFRDLGITSFRILGPTFHAISFGYLLSFFALTFFLTRKYILVLISIIFILIIGTKGPAILTIFSIGFVCLGRIGLSRSIIVRLSVLISICLTVFIFVYGYSVKDYHVLGLIGGVYNFITFPIGKGFGFGGNLSGQVGIDWLAVQIARIAPYGVESSVAVLLNQWGIIGLFYIVFLIKIWLNLLSSFKENGAEYKEQYDFSIYYFSFGFILVNMFFQEETLSPYSLGFELLWVGFLLQYAFKPSEDDQKDEEGLLKKSTMA
ncbi:MAG: hypothetical protein ACRBDL_00855 [Alphaproteobacteria bacterium]